MNDLAGVPGQLSGSRAGRRRHRQPRGAEVRSHEVPFILEHGQVVGRLVYERMPLTLM